MFKNGKHFSGIYRSFILSSYIHLVHLPIYWLYYLIFWCLISWVLYSGYEFPVRRIAGRDFLSFCRLFILVIISFAMQKLFDLMQILLVNSCYYCLLESCSEGQCVCLHLELLFLCFLLVLSSLWSTLSWLLYKVRDRDLFSVFYM
jgi:hypothetical protein